jgi:hypothetical protein
MNIDSRVDAYPGSSVSEHLDAHGWAMVKKLLTTAECEAVAGLYADDRHFRSHIVMARHGFGRGEYKYFRYPLPDTVANLRTALYPRLAPIANRWNVSMGIAVRYPDAHADFIARCHKAGQSGRRRYCCSTARATSTRCTRTCTANMSFRSRWRFCCGSGRKTSHAASSC